MSEKRFKVLSGGFDEEGNPLYLLKDTDTGFEWIGDFEICKKMIEQQSTIKEQNKEIEEWEFSFRTEMALHRVVENELKEKIRKQQSTIAELNKQNEQLQKELNNFKPVIFQDMRKGTIILYTKGGIDE